MRTDQGNENPREHERRERRALLIHRYWDPKDEDQDRFGGQYFVTIVAPTGAGKSSYVQHAMLPYIREQFSPGNLTDWLTVQLLTPGIDPWHNLARSIHLNSGKQNREDPNASEKLADRLADFGASDNLEELLHEALGIGENKNLLIVVDHMEDLQLLQPLRERSQSQRVANFKSGDFLYMLTSVMSNARRTFVVALLREGVAPSIEGRLKNLRWLSLDEIDMSRSGSRESRTVDPRKISRSLQGESLDWFRDPQSQERHLNFYLREFWSRESLMTPENRNRFRNYPRADSLLMIIRDEVLRLSFHFFAHGGESATFSSREENYIALLVRLSGKEGDELRALKRELRIHMVDRNRVTEKLKGVLEMIIRQVPTKVIQGSWLLRLHLQQFAAELETMKPLDALVRFYRNRVAVQLTEAFFRRLIDCNDRERWKPQYAYVSDLSDLLGIPASSLLDLVKKLRAWGVLIPNRFGSEVLGDNVIRLVDPQMFRTLNTEEPGDINPFELFIDEEMRSRALHELLGNILRIEEDNVLLHGTLLQTYASWFGNGDYALKWWRRQRPGEQNARDQGSFGQAMDLIEESLRAEQVIERNKQVIGAEKRRLVRRTIALAIGIVLLLLGGTRYYHVKEELLSDRADLLAYFEVSDFTIDCPRDSVFCAEARTYLTMLDRLEEMRNPGRLYRMLRYPTITDEDIYRQGFHSRTTSALSHFGSATGHGRKIDQGISARGQLRHMSSNPQTGRVLLTMNDSIIYAFPGSWTALFTEGIVGSMEHYEKSFFLQGDTIVLLTTDGDIYHHDLSLNDSRLLSEEARLVTNMTVGGPGKDLCYQKPVDGGFGIFQWRKDAQDRLLHVGPTEVRNMEIAPSGDFLVATTNNQCYVLGLTTDREDVFWSTPNAQDTRLDAMQREVPALEVINDSLIALGSWYQSAQDSVSYSEIWNINRGIRLGAKAWRAGLEQITDMEFVAGGADGCSRYHYLVIPAQDDNVVAWYLDEHFEFVSSIDEHEDYVETSISFNDHQKPVQFVEQFDGQSIVSVANAEDIIEVRAWPFCIHAALKQVRSTVDELKGTTNIMTDGLP